jgi:hypothetical protein
MSKKQKRIFMIGPGMSVDSEDEGPRNSPCHRSIVSVTVIADVPIAKVLVLECGHRVGFIGDPAVLEGRALCQHCREKQKLTRTV